MLKREVQYDHEVEPVPQPRFTDREFSALVMGTVFGACALALCSMLFGCSANTSTPDVEAMGPDAGVAFGDIPDPETQGQACTLTAELVCGVAIDCSPNDNLFDFSDCVDHASAHCLFHHGGNASAPPTNWPACEAVLQRFTCQTTDYYKPCFYPGFQGG